MPVKGYVNAKWVGGFEAELPDSTRLTSGETVVAIPKGEAVSSDHWEPQGGKVSDEEAEAAAERKGALEEGS